MRKQRHTIYTNCPVEAALDIIGGKWKAILLFHVSSGAKRFNELRRLLPSVTQRMLTNQLRELERDGVVKRTVYAQVPPKVEYSITALGATLAPVLKELATWSEAHVRPRLAERLQNESASDSRPPKRSQSSA
jgi:DNA-binding HxlR family transcriptional regulator